MATKDKLVYFNGYGRGEPIRMLYAVAGQELEDVRVEMTDWPAIKADQPLGQLPVLTTSDGVLCQTTTIVRYAAKKLGMTGSSDWEEALHDLVVESCIDIIDEVPRKIYSWKLGYGTDTEPENSEQLLKDIKERLIQKLPYIQTIAEKQGKKFIVGDDIGLAEVWFYTSLDFINLAYPDSKELTPWIKEFVAKMDSDERIKEYVSNRPPTPLGI